MRIQILSDLEVSRLRARLLSRPDALDILLMIIIETGCRGHDAIKLRLNDVTGCILQDPITREPTFLATVNMRSATKRGNTGTYDLTPQLAKAFANFLLLLRAKSNPLFVELEGDLKQESAKKALRRRLIARCEELEIQRISSLHSFRHRVAEMMYRQTGNLLYVQKVLRHKSISSTQHYLGSWDFETAQRKLAEMNKDKF